MKIMKLEKNRIKKHNTYGSGCKLPSKHSKVVTGYQTLAPLQINRNKSQEEGD